jgi:type VI secretion system protein ImpJ
VFAPYDHNDLVRSFAELDGYIQHILGEGDSREFIGIPMIYADGVFSIPFAMEWSGKRLVIALRALGSNESGAAAWCESALIGSHKLQPGMRERRVLGAERQRVLSEKGLYAAPNIVLFHLHEDHDYIHVGEPLDIVGGPASPAGNLPVEIVLYIRQTSN